MINNILGEKGNRKGFRGQVKELESGIALKRLPEAFLCWFMQLISGTRRIDAEMEASLKWLMMLEPHIVDICIWTVAQNKKGPAV